MILLCRKVVKKRKLAICILLTTHILRTQKYLRHAKSGQIAWKGATDKKKEFVFPPDGERITLAIILINDNDKSFFKLIA